MSQAEVDALLAACREVAEGRLDDQFPIDVYQTDRAYWRSLWYQPPGGDPSKRIADR